jgi:hypothetical protein
LGNSGKHLHTKVRSAFAKSVQNQSPGFSAKGKQTRAASRFYLRKGCSNRLKQDDIITINCTYSHAENRVNWLIQGRQLRSDRCSYATFDFVSLNCTADYASGNYRKARLISWQKMKGEIRRRMTLSSFDDIANLVA